VSGLQDQTVNVGGQLLRFNLRRSQKRRTLEISVGPTGDILVTAPASASDERVWAALRRRAPWIRRQKRACEELPVPLPPRQWVAGESHLYLGRQYRLKLRQGPRSEVRLQGRFLEVSVPRPSDPSAVRRAIDRWYRRHAVALLTDRVTRVRQSTSWLRVGAEPRVKVRAMRLRWGSATQVGNLYFSTELIKLPLGCIDYVVVHELAHLQIPHHGPKFWRLMSRCMPDWQRWKKKLEGCAI
jgi:predicted metal-dependent hydrolase